MLVDYSKMKVEDIKQLIVDEAYYTEEELNNMEIKGKSQWVDFHKSLTDEQFVFHAPKIESGVEDIMATTTPAYYDIEWQDYVLSKFDKKTEMVDGKYPSVNGLRRVVELLLGEIVSAGPIDTKVTLEANSLSKAVVTYEINILWRLGPYVDIEEPQCRTFRAIASSCPLNTDDMYAVFPEAIAETRAEGRALRRALRLAVVCADEITRKDTAEIVRQKSEKTTEGDWQENSIITDNQINTIKLLCSRLNIDVDKFINSGSKQYGDILEIPRQTAANMIKRLSQYQSTGSDSVAIPKELLIGA